MFERFTTAGPRGGRRGAAPGARAVDTTTSAPSTCCSLCWTIGCGAPAAILHRGRARPGPGQGRHRPLRRPPAGSWATPTPTRWSRSASTSTRSGPRSRRRSARARWSRPSARCGAGCSGAGAVRGARAVAWAATSRSRPGRRRCSSSRCARRCGSSTSSSASEHILLGLIREGEGLAMKIMVEAGVDLDEVTGSVASPRTSLATRDGRYPRPASEPGALRARQ